MLLVRADNCIMILTDGSVKDRGADTCPLGRAVYFQDQGYSVRAHLPERPVYLPRAKL
jgi:hypothetical protein